MTNEDWCGNCALSKKIDLVGQQRFNFYWQIWIVCHCFELACLSLCFMCYYDKGTLALGSVMPAMLPAFGLVQHKSVSASNAVVSENSDSFSYQKYPWGEPRFHIV